MKIVINVCYGGFGLSEAALKEYWKLKNNTEVYPLMPEYDMFVDKPVPAEFSKFINGEDSVDDSNKELFDKWVDAHIINTDYPRDDEILVKVVESLGEKADGRYAKLKVVEIPDGIKWHIEEYDGMEHIAEDHQTWY